MPVLVLIIFVLLIAYAVLIDYYRRAWNKIPEHQHVQSSRNSFISVIIPARNEENNIGHLLNSLNNQSYPSSRFEVIVVDDHSTDGTWQILENFSGKIDLRPVKLSEFIAEGQLITAHKKKAIEAGISIAKGELIVATDADCVMNTDWLACIADFYESKQAKFIAAPVRISTNNTLISFFQTLDFITLQGITGASVYRKFHSMCNGANLAYEKKAFQEVNGFAGIDAIPSGDDMLLMHKIYRKHPHHVFYLKNAAAIVTTQPMRSWKEFFQQRIRWASKADSYDDKRIFWVLLLVYFLNLSFLILFLWSFFNINGFFFLLLFLLAKVLIEFPFVNSVAIFFGQQKLMRYFFIFQPLHIIYTIVAGWLGKFGTFQWKGRAIKTRKS